MTTVIRINLLYSQTALIIAGPVSHYRMRENKSSTVNVIFRLLKANTWRLENKYCNRNELKQCTNTWQIIEVSNSTKQHTDNSGNHADL